ncbi:MAG: s-methyl-5-thioribose-1-phosphate isomerase [Candidatus Bathyarchaeia archaeon]
MNYRDLVIKKLDLVPGDDIDLMVDRKTRLPVTLWYDHEKDELILVDQNRLPFEFTTWRSGDWKDAVAAIKDMTVRGSQAIGVAAGYAVLMASLDIQTGIKDELIKRADVIMKARPTAAPLTWASKLVLESGIRAFDSGGRRDSVIEAMRQTADFILFQDMALNYYLRKEGLSLLNNGDVVMTHCNGGSLSSTLMGHALGVIEEAVGRGLNVSVVSKETRPRSQGYRLTVWELNRAGVPVTIVTDNMVSISIERLKVNKIMLGADRVSKDGSVANKVGSADIARVAKFYKVPFYYSTSYSTISLDVEHGEEIEIEERDISEVTIFYKLLAARLKMDGKISQKGLDEWPPKSLIVSHEPISGEVRIFNPAFDVTPPNLITAINTDIGIFKPEEIGYLTPSKITKMVRDRLEDFGIKIPEGLGFLSS